MTQITKELQDIILDLKNESFVCDEIFVKLSIANTDSSLYQFLKKNMITADLQSAIEYYSSLTDLKNSADAVVYIDNLMEKVSNKNSVSSLDLFGVILENNNEIKKYFKGFGINKVTIINSNIQKITNKSKEYKKYLDSKPKSLSNTNVSNDKNSITSNNMAGDAEKNLQKIVVGEKPVYYGKQEVIDSIWESIVTKENRTIVLNGEFGRENLIEHLVWSVNNKDVPYGVEDKVFLKIDLPALISDISLKGAFENKFRRIIKDAKIKDKYIFVIDDSENIVEEPTYAEFHFSTMLKELVSCGSLPLIILSKGDPKWLDKGTFKRFDLNKYTTEEFYMIIKRWVDKIGSFHNVSIEDNLIVKICNNISCDNSHFRIVAQFFDNLCSSIKLKDNIMPRLRDMRDKLSDIIEKRDKYYDSTNNVDDDVVDSFYKEEIEIKGQIAKLEKESKLYSKQLIVTTNDALAYLKKKIGNSQEIHSELYEKWKDYLEETEDKTVTIENGESLSKLKSFNDDAKKIVIGQDNVIDEISQIVKRQALGFNLDKPSVVLCAGSTGIGKTYLCKVIAKLIYGSENNMIRLDMSEYSEKNSVTKLYGTSAGYVGYENGGVLTESVKKMKKGVLLLDEVEKAHSEVFDAFLQVFDEGRLTDNHGVTVSFKDFIIVMTSNIGAVESSLANGGVGFHKNDVETEKKDAVLKVMKQRFKPEFLNRIDKILHFNSLSDDNLKKIIRLELGKLIKNIQKIGYEVGDEPYNDDLVEMLFEKVKNDKEYGARPIIRIIKSEVEDKLIQKIIDNDLNKGYLFEKIWLEN